MGGKPASPCDQHSCSRLSPSHRRCHTTCQGFPPQNTFVLQLAINEGSGLTQCYTTTRTSGVGGRGNCWHDDKPSRPRITVCRTPNQSWLACLWLEVNLEDSVLLQTTRSQSHHSGLRFCAQSTCVKHWEGIKPFDLKRVEVVHSFGLRVASIQLINMMCLAF